jgi:hypothetical protein
MRLSDRLGKLRDRLGTIYHDVGYEINHNQNNELRQICDEIYSVCDEMDDIIYDLRNIGQEL